jgi:hypothetical protein
MAAAGRPRYALLGAPRGRPAPTVTPLAGTQAPEFVIDGIACVAMPVDLASIPLSALGEVVANLADRSDTIIRAIDEVVARH